MSSSARKINIGVWMYEYDIIIVESIVLISNSFRSEYRHTDTGCSAKWANVWVSVLQEKTSVFGYKVNGEFDGMTLIHVK